MCCLLGSKKYPLRGLLYMLTSPSLWGTVFLIVSFGILVSITSLILVFTFAFQPQMKLIADGEAWYSSAVAIFLCLLEASLITLVMLFLVLSSSRKKVFVKTMQLEGKWKTEEMVEPTVAKDINCCRIGFIVSTITLPLHVIIPVIGTFIYAYINAPFAAWDCMDMYFDAIHMDESLQREELNLWNREMYSTKYVGFGFVAILLESIPILGPSLCSLGNACGAALWACDMEARGRPMALQELASLDDKSRALV